MLYNNNFHYYDCLILVRQLSRHVYYMWEVKHGESIGLTGCKTQIWLHSNMHSSSLIVNVVDTLSKLSYQKHGNTGNCMEAYVTVFLCNNPVKHKFTNSSTIIYHSDLSLKIQISPQSRIDGLNVIGRIGLEGKSLSWDIPLSLIILRDINKKHLTCPIFKKWW